MPCLLSLDFEFTHPSPKVGKPMQLGIAVCDLGWKKDPRFKYRQPVFGTELMKWQSLFGIPSDGFVATKWVIENQGNLLSRCQSYPDPEAFNAERIEALKAFLKDVDEKFGAPVIPVGWCMSSDMAYLLDLLGEDCDLVHYAARDLGGMLTGMTGDTAFTDRKTKAYLGVPPNENPHDALADAEHQLLMVQAAMHKAWQRACLLTSQGLHAPVGTLQDLGLIGDLGLPTENS